MFGLRRKKLYREMRMGYWLERAEGKAHDRPAGSP